MRVSLLAGTIVLSGLIAEQASAALIVSYNFDASTDAPSFIDPNVTANDLTLGSGAVSAGFSSGGRLAQSLNTTSIDLAAYYSITFQPNAGYTLDLTSFSFDFRKTHSNAANNWAVRYSVDSFANNLSSGTQTETLQNATILLSNTGLTGLIEFRIYGWNAAASNRNMLIDNVTVNGNVSAIPEPASLALLTLGGLLMLPRRTAKKG